MFNQLFKKKIFFCLFVFCEFFETGFLCITALAVLELFL